MIRNKRHIGPRVLTDLPYTRTLISLFGKKFPSGQQDTRLDIDIIMVHCLKSSLIILVPLCDFETAYARLAKVKEPASGRVNPG
ncbi:hypothetical protein D3C72_986940 [compost metagenome]